MIFLDVFREKDPMALYAGMHHFRMQAGSLGIRAFFTDGTGIRGKGIALPGVIL